MWDGIIRSSADTLPISKAGEKKIKNPKTKLYGHGANEERFTQKHLLTLNKNKESL